jgi:6-phosphogluconolactonase
MKFKVFADPNAVAQRAATIIAEAARAAVAARGRFIIAVSGGETPLLMFDALDNQEMPWEQTYMIQVDERVAPAGHADRNLTHLRKRLLTRVLLRPEQLLAMPVEASDLETAARQYAQTLIEIAGSPPVLDLIHLGLGPDGHTASLVPGDAVLDVDDADVALTGVYKGRRRMTLTYPIIDRSRCILWVVTGKEKAEMLILLQGADPSIPAGRVRQDQGLVLADRAAATLLEKK